MISHKTLMQWHMWAAAFTFPGIVLVLVTGALYTWGIKGDYVTRDYAVTLSQPLAKDADALTALATSELAQRAIGLPSGKPGVKSIGDGWQMEWTGTRRDVLLAPTADPLVAKLVVKDTTPHRFFVQLHKAKGGTVYKVYAVLVALALAFLVGSGLIMAWTVKWLRPGMLTAGALGTAAFIAAALTS